jgi:hypothetical protein
VAAYGDSPFRPLPGSGMDVAFVREEPEALRHRVLEGLRQPELSFPVKLRWRGSRLGACSGLLRLRSPPERSVAWWIPVSHRLGISRCAYKRNGNRVDFSCLPQGWRLRASMKER